MTKLLQVSKCRDVRLARKSIDSLRYSYLLPIYSHFKANTHLWETKKTFCSLTLLHPLMLSYLLFATCFAVMWNTMLGMNSVRVSLFPNQSRLSSLHQLELCKFRICHTKSQSIGILSWCISQHLSKPHKFQ
jgi:hypothetical protein